MFPAKNKSQDTKTISRTNTKPTKFQLPRPSTINLGTNVVYALVGGMEMTQRENSLC